MKEDTQNSFIGRILGGRYRITECLAKGGMGVVFKGERLQLGRPVAIKFLQEPLNDSPEFLARFEREAKAMSQMSHPNCVSVIDFGVDELPFIVMDFVTGDTLRQILDDGPVATGRAVHIAKQLLASLAHAHKQGIIHRDIKPDNIMISEATGMGDHVRIFDFGLAKLMDPGSETNLSRTDMAMGTPNYMSPEQTVGKPADARSDLYATGVVLFELLTGRKPFYEENSFKVMQMHRDSAPPTLHMAGSGKVFSREIEFVVAKSLEKQPEKRFQSAMEFAEALAMAPESKLAPIAFEITPEGGVPTTRADRMDTVSLGVTPDETPPVLEDPAPVDAASFAPIDERSQKREAGARAHSSHRVSAFLIFLIVGALGLGFLLRDKLDGLFFSGTSGVDTNLESLKQRINDTEVSILKSTVRPEQEPTTVLPEQEPATVLPEQEPTTALPEQEPATVLPEQEPATVLPEQEPAAVLPPAPEPAVVLPPAPEPAAVLSPAPEPAAVLPPAPEPAAVLSPAPEPAVRGIDAADALKYAANALEYAVDALEDAADLDLEDLPRVGDPAGWGDEAGFEDAGSEFAKVQQLIDAKQYDEAIEALRSLRREDPSKALYPYVMAEVFFKKHWLKDSLDLYGEAMRLNPSLRGKRTLNENLISMLEFDQVSPRARVMIIKQVGRTALPYLRRAAKNDSSATVRKRAASIAATFAKSKPKSKSKAKSKSRSKSKSRRR